MTHPEIQTRPERQASPQPTTLTALALLFAATLTIMAGATIAPSLPAMREHFSALPQSDVLVRLVLTLPALVVALTSPLMGVLSDRWGRKPLLLAGLVLYVVAGSAGFVIEQLWLMLLSRALLGVAVAAVMTANTALMADLFQGEARNRILGMQGVFSNAGGTLFLVVGGLLAQQHWHLPFLIYLLPVLLLPLVWAQVPAVRAQPPASAAASRLPMNVLWPIYAAAFLTFLLFYLIPTQLPFYLTGRCGASSGVSGLMVALTNLIGIFAGLLYVRVGSRLAPVRLGSLAFALLGLGLMLVGLSGSYLGIGLGVLGLGVGLSFPNLTAWLTQVAPVAVRGRAIGLLSSSLFLGQFMSPLLTQPVAHLTSLRSMFWLVGGFALLVALVFSRLRTD